MARLYIFTTGTSLISNLRKHGPEGASRADALQQYAREKPADFFWQAVPDESWQGNPVGDFQGDPGAWWLVNFYAGLGAAAPALLPAEISNFKKLNPQPGDEVVLLASDTPLGVFCAVVIAHLMALPGRDRVVEWTSPCNVGQVFNWNPPQTAARDTGILGQLREKVAVMRIPKLNPGHKEGFEQEAVGNLVRTVARLSVYARGKELEQQIIFTGGYKVTLPVLTQAAAWLDGIPMVALYEEDHYPIEIPVLSSPPGERARKAVLGWVWSSQDEVHARERARLKRLGYDQQLARWGAVMSRKTFTGLEARDKPLFEPDGQHLRLSILGEALLAVLLYSIAGE